MLPILAYIDPGTGNALIYVILGAFFGMAYFLKDLFYKVVHRRQKMELKKIQKNTTNAHVPIEIDQTNTLALFSEGKNYWATYQPIIEALIQRKKHFHYYTMDRHDPALTIENEFMHSKYIGQGVRGQKKMYHLNHPILLTTTPNIGSLGHPLQKPPLVQKLIHVFHSVADLSMYKKHSLDAYDVVYLAGDFQKKSIREIESKRGLPAKELSLAGLPYLDSFAKDIAEHGTPESKKQTTVLVASSWGKKGCLTNFGTSFVKLIAEAGYQIILRPHPQSYISEPELIQRFERELKKIPNVVWDKEISPIPSMMLADIMVSDTSSVRFDYAFLTGKPVISLEIPTADMEEYEYADLSEKNSLESMNTLIGYPMKQGDESQLLPLIDKALMAFPNQDIAAIRDQTVAHFGRSGEAIAELLIKDCQLATGDAADNSAPISREDFNILQDQLRAIHEDLALIKKAVLDGTPS